MSSEFREKWFLRFKKKKTFISWKKIPIYWFSPKALHSSIYGISQFAVCEDTWFVQESWFCFQVRILRDLLLIAQSSSDLIWTEQSFSEMSSKYWLNRWKNWYISFFCGFVYRPNSWIRIRFGHTTRDLCLNGLSLGNRSTRFLQWETITVTFLRQLMIGGKNGGNDVNA